MEHQLCVSHSFLNSEYSIEQDSFLPSENLKFSDCDYE